MSDSASNTLAWWTAQDERRRKTFMEGSLCARLLGFMARNSRSDGTIFIVTHDDGTGYGLSADTIFEALNADSLAFDCKETKT